jgi:hypothetical protein
LIDQMPTGRPLTDVVGESHHHADLASLMAALRSDLDANEAWTAARLVRDPQNRYDRNAVRVEIHGRLVGHLPREDAEDIQRWLKLLERQRRPAFVLARLGGGRSADGVVGPIGVTLVDLPGGSSVRVSDFDATVREVSRALPVVKLLARLAVES